MECALDLGHGIACKNHREEVEVLNLSPIYYTGGPPSLLLLGNIWLLGGAAMMALMGNTNGLILTFMGLGLSAVSFMFVLGSRNRLRKRINK
jgi:hypothetical protein